MKKNILIFIGARGGSKGVKGKNVRPILGKPLMAYTIEQALAWGKGKRVIVSTDSKEIAAVGEKYGALVPFMRPKHLATDSISKGPAIRHALERCEEIYKEKYAIIVDLDITSPVRTTKDLDRCLEIFLKKAPLTLFSVVEAHKNPYFNMVEIKKNGNPELVIKTETRILGRQTAPKVYAMNGSIYFYDRQQLLSSQDPSPFSAKTEIYEMDPIASIDIDREIDFKFNEFLFKEGLVSIKPSQEIINYPARFSLKDKVVFVCGGAGLIGVEVSKAVAQSGALTVILDINKKGGAELKEVVQKQGYTAEYEYFDISKVDKLELELNRIIRKYGKLDAWVNLSYPRTSDWQNKLEDVKIASFCKNIDIHMNSAVWASTLIALYMRRNKIKGSIINFGSIYGIKGNDLTIYKDAGILTTPMAYFAIKGGIINVTRYFASYFGKDNIRFNTICPGGIESSDMDTIFKRNYSRKVPLGRLGRADDIGGSVIFLASDASAYVTGETMMVDGGWSVV